MTTEQRSEALKVLAQIVTDQPDARTLTMAEQLLDVLNNAPDTFWQTYMDRMSADPAFRLEADAFMAERGINAETREAIFS